MKKKFQVIVLALFISWINYANAQYEDFHNIKCEVDFGNHLRVWDGFGVNYVQTAHTKNYKDNPQEYGGFSLLKESDKDSIINMIFGENGLKPGLLKMFLDPLHQTRPDGPFDHTTSTGYMREFIKKGIEKSNEDGRDLKIITTLYGPPAYATKQKVLRGRDLDPQQKENLANYMVDWVKFLKMEGYPIKYLSLHNEGEDWRRWPTSGKFPNFEHGHDYNAYWSPEEVAEYIALLRPMMDKQGLQDVGITPGETSKWYQFDYWGYADAIINNKDALNGLGLITSHNFYVPAFGRWFSGTSNLGTQRIREHKPDMKAWVTSFSWGKMNTDFICQIYMNIYLSEVNGMIPWAVIQRPRQWVGGDPNPGTAFNVSEDGSFKVQPGYYLYKQVCRAGQPGMAVAQTKSRESEILLMGFANNNSGNKDAFVVVNTGIYATNRADAVDLYFQVPNGSNSIKKNYHFSLKDPMARSYDDADFSIAKTSAGYNLEVAIDLKSLNTSITEIKNKDIGFNIILQDGETELDGKLEWDAKGKLSSNLQIAKSQKPKIDGKSQEWVSLRGSRIDKKLYETTSDTFSGNWKAMNDENKLYLLIEIQDPSNVQGRQLEIDVKGASANQFEAYRTTEDGEMYKSIGEFKIEHGKIRYLAPPRSVTTFFAK